MTLNKFSFSTLFYCTKESANFFLVLATSFPVFVSKTDFKPYDDKSRDITQIK